MTAPDIPSTQSPVNRRVSGRRRAWAFASLVVLVSVGYCAYQPTASMVLVGPAAGVYQTLSYTRHVSYWIDRTGRRSVDTAFRVAYYANVVGADSMQAEARRIAPALLPFADSAGLRHLELKPSRPLLTRAFPLAILSHDVHFRRQASGTWREAEQ